MKQMRHVLTYYHQPRGRKIVFILLLAGFASTVATGSALATSPTYNCGAYGGGGYNNTCPTAAAAAPDTGDGSYSPGTAQTRTSHTIKWSQLAGGVALIAAGIGSFRLRTERDSHSQEGG